MFKDAFLGHRPSHFQMNSTVKAFILSETIFWSAWNFAMPIFAIFASADIKGGSVEVAASVISVYLMVRVVIELITGKFLVRTTMSKKLLVTVAGMIFIVLSFLGFAFTKSVPVLYLCYVIAGIGMGIASPAKNSLFSTHLDKNKETSEWGLYDASVFIGMALATALGGFIVKNHGFQILFLLSALLTFVSIIPYLLYVRSPKNLYETFKKV